MVVQQRKRPWFLVLALFGALALGTAGAFQGWATYVTYHDPIDLSAVGSEIADEADRAAVITRVQSFVQVLDSAKSRMWPLGVASLLLGSAMFVFAMRALGGSAGARVALVQLVLAQAGANAASYFLLRDVFDADLRVREAEDAARAREQIPEHDRAEYLHLEGKVRRASYSVAVVLDTLTSALIIFGLTRRRSLEYFEAAGNPVQLR
jgi:hypothetical protein